MKPRKPASRKISGVDSGGSRHTVCPESRSPSWDNLVLTHGPHSARKAHAGALGCEFRNLCQNDFSEIIAAVFRRSEFSVFSYECYRRVFSGFYISHLQRHSVMSHDRANTVRKHVLGACGRGFARNATTHTTSHTSHVHVVPAHTHARCSCLRSRLHKPLLGISRIARATCENVAPFKWEPTQRSSDARVSRSALTSVESKMKSPSVATACVPAPSEPTSCIKTGSIMRACSGL